MAGPASLVYRRGSRSSTSLATLLEPPTPVDPSVLAAWVVGAPPNATRRTPYEGVDVEHVTRPCEPGAESPSLGDAPSFLRRALVAAVDRALAGVRRVAVMTGGIDSSVLLGLATDWAKRTGGSAFSITLDFDGPGSDRPHVGALERYLGCEVVRIAPEEAAPRVALLETGVDAAPVWHPMMPMEVELLARARANGAERVLCGGGADELFGGSPQALAELAWRGHPIRAVRAAHRLSGFGRPRARAWTWVLRPLLGRAMPLSVRRWRARRDARYAPPDWAGPVLRSFHAEQRRRACVHIRPPPRTQRQRFEAIRDDPYRMVLAWGGHQEEHAGAVDMWWPYLDLELAAAVATMQPDYLLFGDRWRGLLRASIRGIVPESIRQREDKASFEPAMKRFIDAAGGLESLRPLASVRELSSLGIVDASAFAAAFEQFVADPLDGYSWISLWPVLAVEAFLRGRLR